MSGGKIIGTELRITKALATLEREHNKYLANQPLWNQYVVWTYTLGSQPVNRRLVGFPVLPIFSQRWSYEFFNNFTYGLNEVGEMFKKYINLFANPNLYLKLTNQQKDEIAEDLLDLYSKNLQSIILNSPPTRGDIVVYKASTPYDEKLIKDNFPFTLEQTPFNSTSYDPWFDFGAFLGSNKDVCCLWEILIPKGSQVLAIAPSFQAYLIEREILLPYGSVFNVIGATNVGLSYWCTRETPTRVQNPPYYIGEVYRQDIWEQRELLERNVRLLIAIFSN
jgi:signal peptidase I